MTVTVLSPPVPPFFPRVTFTVHFAQRVVAVVLSQARTLSIFEL